MWPKPLLAEPRFRQTQLVRTDFGCVHFSFSTYVRLLLRGSSLWRVTGRPRAEGLSQRVGTESEMMVLACWCLRLGPVARSGGEVRNPAPIKQHSNVSSLRSGQLSCRELPAPKADSWSEEGAAKEEGTA